MSSTRTSATFFIVASSSGRLIKVIQDKRRSFGDGPFVKVHNEVICLNKADGDNYTEKGILYIPNKIANTDITGTGHLKVKRVEISSWSALTTEKMVKFFWAASKVNIHKGSLDIEGLVGNRNAAKVTAILFGKGGRNIRAIVNRQAKTFTQREVAPFLLHIHAYSVKDKLAVEIRLKKKIISINNDLIEKGHVKKFGETPTAPKKSKRVSQNRFGDLEMDDTPDAFPELVGSMPVPARRLFVAPHETLAAKLEDASARGEVFKDYSPTDVVRPECMRDATDSDDSGYDEMPILEKGMTGDEIFASVNTTMSGEWS